MKKVFFGMVALILGGWIVLSMAEWLIIGVVMKCKAEGEHDVLSCVYGDTEESSRFAK